MKRQLGVYETKAGGGKTAVFFTGWDRC